MMMNAGNSECDETRIFRLLERQLTDREQDELESHLERCVVCCERLRAAAANPTVWHNAVEFLRDSQFELSPLSCDHSTREEKTSANLSSTVWQREVARLSPSDDPRMLGRVGQYEVAGVIGCGGTGVVLKAFDPALNRYVAIKILKEDLADSGSARKRFAREARAASSVVHENVIEIHGVSDDASITRTGVIAGTPQYMSPEQSRGEPVDYRSDLFSLGSVLYSMCTGRPPFRGDTSCGVMRRITDEQPSAIREINPSIPIWLCTIITTLMEKHRDNRFASASEVAELLEDCLAHLQQPTVTPLPAGIASQPTTQFRVLTHYKGYIAMTTALGLLAMVLWQATAAPDISGRWTSDYWGQVTLDQTNPGSYSGTYADAFDGQSGKIEINWSRSERRFNGTWREGEERSGGISLRYVDNQVRGAWTSNATEDESDRPRLGDLLWVRLQKKEVASRVSKLEVVGSSARHNGNSWPGSFPPGLVDRLAKQKGKLVVPTNVTVEEMPEHYEVAAAPWRTIVYMITDGHGAPEHETHIHDDGGGHRHDAHDQEADNANHTHEAHVADEPHPPHDHSHDADHTHNVQQHEYFADRGKLIVGKAKESEIMFELSGNAGYESPIINYSAHNITFHLEGENPRMILAGNARFANESKNVKMSADKITNYEMRVVLEGNARLRRNSDSPRPELISADRIDLDLETNSVSLGALKERSGHADLAIGLLEIDLDTAELRLATATTKLRSVEGQEGAIPRSKMLDRQQAVEQGKLDVKRIEVLLDAARKEAERSESRLAHDTNTQSGIGTASGTTDARCEILRQRLKLVVDQYQAGEASTVDVLTARKQLAAAEIVAAQSPLQRHNARQQHVDALRALIEVGKQLHERQEIGQADVLAIEAELAEAETQLKDAAQSNGLPQ